MDGQSTPLSPEDRLGDELRSMKERIGELERALASTVLPDAVENKVSKTGDSMTGDLQMGSNDVTGVGTFAGSTVDITGDSEIAGQLVLSDNEDVSGQGTGALIIGTQSGQQIAIDSNEIQAYSSGGVGAILNLNIEADSAVSTGGALNVGGTVTVGAGNTAGRIVLPVSVNPKVRLYGDSANYEIGVSSGTMYFNGGSYFRFRTSGGTDRARIDTVDGDIYAGLGSTGRLRTSNTYGATEVGPINSSYSHMYTDRATWYFDENINVDTGVISSHDENLVLRDAGTTVLTMDAANSVNGTVTLTAGSNNGAGNQSALRILTRSSTTAALGGTAGMTFQTTFSTDRHVHARVYYASGDELGFRNYENTIWVPLKASAFTVGSSRLLKNRIRTGRDEGGLLDYAIPGDRVLAFDQMRKVRPVLFDDITQETLRVWDGCHGKRVKNKARKQEVLDGVYGTDDLGARRKPTVIEFHDSREECAAADCEGKDNLRTIEHHCDDYECGGTAERPCKLIERHIDRPGLIAEELDEIFPKAVTKDMFGEELGIDYAVVTVELINTIQHMLEDRDELLERIEALESPRGRRT